MSMTAFDLEQDILKCWNITSDIAEILDDLESGHMEIHEAAQALRAYQQVYERRFERCFRRFEQFNQEVWELRRSTVPAEDLDSVNMSPKNRGKMAKSNGQKEVDH